MDVRSMVLETQATWTVSLVVVEVDRRVMAVETEANHVDIDHIAVSRSNTAEEEESTTDRHVGMIIAIDEAEEEAVMVVVVTSATVDGVEIVNDPGSDLAAVKRWDPCLIMKSADDTVDQDLVYGFFNLRTGVPSTLYPYG